MNLNIGNTTTVTSLTGLRLNVITLAGQQGIQGPVGPAGTGAGGGNSFSGDMTIPYNTVANAISLFNKTKAVNTGNAYSPFIEQQGFGWKTAGSGSSVPLEFRYGVKPERSFAGGGNFVLEASLNSGVWVTGLQIDNNGNVTISQLNANTANVGILYGQNIIAQDGPVIFQSSAAPYTFALSADTGRNGNLVLSTPGPGSTLSILGDSTISGTGVPTTRTINSIPLTGNVNLTATNIPVAIAPGAGYSNLQQFINTMHSPGLIDGATISDAGGGIAHIAPGTGMLRIADDNISSLLFVSMTGTNISVPQDLTQYYVGFVYNSGAPMYQMRATNNWDNDTEIALGTVVNFFGTIIVSNNPFLVGDPITNIIQRFDAIQPITRDQVVGGLNLGEAGTRNIVLSAGKLWTRLNDYSVPAINSSVTPMYSAYYNGFYWNYTTAVTQWDNTSYNDVTAGLVPVSVGYYTNLWFYLTVESNSLGFIYDQNQYGDLTSASLAQAPSFLPTNFTNGSILLGRLLFHQGATVADRIDSAFVATFTSAPITSHNQLAGLQGGTASQYYHLSQNDYSVLTGRAGTTIVHAVNGLADYPIITGAQGITVSATGQLITISGQDWATNANLTATGAALVARDGLVSGSATSGIAASGSSLYSLITSLSGQANLNYATSSNLALTGSGLYSQLTGMSGQFNTNLTTTGVTLGARDALISGISTTGLTNTGATLYNLIVQASGAANTSYATIAQYSGLSGTLGVTGSTLDTKINGLSGFTINVSGALNALIVGGGGTQVKATGSSTLTTANFTGAGSVTVSLSGSQVLISGLAGTTQAQLDLLSGWSASAINLGATGTALLARDFLTSGILASGIATTGSNLYGIITGLSGQAVSSYATISNLALTGSNLYVLITGMSGQANTNYATVTNLTLTGQYLYNLVTNLSGQATGAYATIANLALTGSGLYRTMTGMSGVLVALIGASAAGVSSLNGASGVLNIAGAGNVNVTTIGQNITVSGNTGDYAFFALKTDVTTTGQQIVLVSGALDNKITFLSGYTNTFLVHRTGSELISGQKTFILSGAQNFIIKSGNQNFFQVGPALCQYTRGDSMLLLDITSFALNDNAGAGSISWDARQLSDSTVTPSLNWQNRQSFDSSDLLSVDWNSGYLYNAGGAAVLLDWRHSTLSGEWQINTNGINSGTIVNFGRLSNVSGALSTIRVTGSSVIQIANFTGLGGTQIIYSGGTVFISGGAGGGGGITQGQLDSLSGWSASAFNLATTGSNLYNLITGLSGQTVGAYATITNLALTGSALYALTTGLSGQAVSTYATITNLALTGSNLYITVTGLSGAFNTIIANTGSQAWNAANTNAIILSGNATQSGVQLYNLITGMSGQDVTNYATKTSLTASGALLSAVQITGSSILNVVNLTGINGIGVIYSGTQVLISGNNVFATGSRPIPNANFTGIGTTVITYDGALISISGAPAGTGAGVSSVNGAGNAINLITAGAGIQITNVGGNIFISGNPTGITVQGNGLQGSSSLTITGLAGHGIVTLIESGINRSQSMFGPAMWTKSITYIGPQTTTTLQAFGNTASNVGTVSTVSTEGMGQYSNVITAATPYTVAGLHATTAYYFRGSVTGRNGFFFTSTFALSDGSDPTGAYGQPSGSRLFIGMTDQTSTATVITNDPAGNRIGLSYVSTTGGTQANRFDTNWVISAKDNTTEFTGQTPMTFLTGLYRFSMYAPPFAVNNTGVFWQIDDLLRGSGVAGIITGRLPIGSTQLRPSAYICAATGGARNLRLMSIYAENAGAT